MMEGISSFGRVCWRAALFNLYGSWGYYSIFTTYIEAEHQLWTVLAQGKVALLNLLQRTGLYIVQS